MFHTRALETHLNFCNKTNKFTRIKCGVSFISILFILIHVPIYNKIVILL